MDIIIHIAILTILALLFFIYKFSQSHNPMLFIIIISIIGLITLYNDPTYITTGYNTTTIWNYTANTATSQSFPIQQPFGFDWALYLSYIFFFVISSIYISTGEVYNKKK